MDRIRRTLAKFLRPTVWVTLETAFGEFVNLALFVVQAPILGPAAFGLFAAGMVFVMFWEAVVALAASEALMSVRNEKPLHYSTATTALIIGCVAYGAGMFALARPIAGLFGSDDLVVIFRVMAIFPLIQAFSVAPVAAAQRAMQFQTTTLRTTISLVAGAVVGLALTLAGAGVWALVWQACAQRVVANIVLWYAVPIRFSLRFSRSHFRDLIPFVPVVGMARAMAWGSTQLPRMILGVYMGTTSLGLFSVAQRLYALVNMVALQPKARVARVDLLRFIHDPEGMREAARSMYAVLALFTFPICVGGAVVTPTLFHVWLDSHWAGAVVPSQLLFIACMPLVTFFGATSVLYALNLQRWDMLIMIVSNVLMLLALVVGGPFGLTAASALFTVAAFLPLPLPIYVLRRKCGFSIGDVLGPQARPFVSAVVMGVAVWLAGVELEPYVPELANLIIMVSLGVVIYVALLLVMLPQQSGRLVAAVRNAL